MNVFKPHASSGVRLPERFSDTTPYPIREVEDITNEEFITLLDLQGGLPEMAPRDRVAALSAQITILVPSLVAEKLNKLTVRETNGLATFIKTQVGVPDGPDPLEPSASAS